MLTLGIRLIKPCCSRWRLVRLMRRVQPGRKVFGCVRVMPGTLFSEFRGRTQGFRVASIRRADRAGPPNDPVNVRDMGPGRRGRARRPSLPRWRPWPPDWR